MLSRHLRPNNILGKLIPPLLVLLGVKGYRLVTIETSNYLDLIQGRPLLASVYRWQFRFFLAALTYAFGLVYLPSRNHSRPPKEPPAEVMARTVVYQCDSAGEPARCSLGECDGSWRSARTRHCGDCGRCKDTFDHHCPFMDSCITQTRTFKPFVCFLFYAVFLIGFAIIPLIPLEWAAISEIREATWDLEWMHVNWWTRWYSWIGGPVYRYAIALLLGYAQYPKLDPPRPPLIPPLTHFLTKDGVTYAYDESPCPSLAYPSYGALLIVAGGAFVFWVAIAMIVTIVLNARRGLGAVQVERSRRWRLQRKSGIANAWDARLTLWIPLPEGGGAVVRVDPAIRLFDLGPSRNWRNLMGERWWRWFLPWVPSRTSDFEFNQEVLRILCQEVRERSE